MQTTSPKSAVFLLLLTLGVACGGGGASQPLVLSEEVLWQTGLTGEHAEAPVKRPPTGGDGETFPQLALPEYVDGDPVAYNDPVATDCAEAGEATWPREEGGGGQTVTLTGLVTKFGAGSQPRDLCVALLDYDAFVASGCVTGDPEAWEECLGADLCADPGALGEVGGKDILVGKAVSEPAPGNADAGVYSIPNVPVETDLVLKVSGMTMLWKDTYKYGIRIPAAQAALGEVVAEASIISASSWQTVPASTGMSSGVQPGNGVVAGTVADCGGGTDPAMDDPSCDPAKSCAPEAECSCQTEGYACVPDGAGGGTCTRVPWTVVGATVGLTRQATKIAYFQGREGDNLPQPGRRYTNVLGTYAAIDLPAGPVTAVAVVGDGAGVRLAGQATVFVAPGTVSILSFRGGWTGHFPWYL